MIKVKKKSIKSSLIIIIIILILILGALIFLYFTSKQKLEEYNTELLELHAKLEANNKYASCLITPYKSEEVDTLFNELLNTLNTNELSIYFEDLNNDYTLTINPDTIYYNASIIKLFDASYIIDNNVDLNDTITFTEEYRNLAKEEGLLKYEVNSEIPIKDILYYLISVSENAAHRMLTDYIGVNNLKEYAKNTLEVNLTINENDRFGYMNVTSTNTLLKHIYELLQNDNEYTTLLKDAMNNTYYNALNFDDKNFLHKYGYYSRYFHDIGIYDNTNPYTISIFTTFGNPDNGALDKVSNISKEIYNIYQTNLNKKEEYCYKQAYN